MFNRNKKKMKSDKPLESLSRMLDKLEENKIDLSEGSVEAIICNDGAIIVLFDENQTNIMMIKSIHNVDFSLNLTEEEMQDFNGGKGLMARYSRHKE